MSALPWDYSAEGTPESGVPNEPSPEGEALGREIARLVEASRQDDLLAQRCADCATRLGSVPNRCAATGMDVLKAAAEGKPFFCHHGGDPRLCPGWLVTLNPLLGTVPR